VLALEVERPLALGRSASGPHLVFDEPPHAAELPQAVEVARERHVRVRRLLRGAFRVVEPFGGSEKRRVSAKENRLHRPARRGDPHVKAARRVGIEPREERLRILDPRRREDREEVSSEERPHLLLRPAHRRRRGDDLRPDSLARRERFDRRLVQPRHRSQRPGDEMELVLHDELRRE
jgi:hypothetical protein